MLKDTPIMNKEQDQLGRNQFAQKLATAILSYIKMHSDDKEGIVIGLEGAWGSGKTSLIHLIENNLRESDQVNLKTSIFNSWLSVNRDRLVWDFFETLDKSAFQDRWKTKKGMQSYANRF